MRIRQIVSRVIRVVWWISLVWLAFALVAEAWWFVGFLGEPDKTARLEYGVGAAIIFMFYSWPAAVGMLVAVLVPGTKLSTSRKLIGVALLLGCIAVLFLFKDHFWSLQ